MYNSTHLLHHMHLLNVTSQVHPLILALCVAMELHHQECTATQPVRRRLARSENPPQSTPQGPSTVFQVCRRSDGLAVRHSFSEQESEVRSMLMDQSSKASNEHGVSGKPRLVSWLTCLLSFSVARGSAGTPPGHFQSQLAWSGPLSLRSPSTTLVT